MTRPSRRIIAGVCAGFVEHTGLPVTVVRIATLLLVLAGGGRRAALRLVVGHHADGDGGREQRLSAARSSAMPAHPGTVQVSLRIQRNVTRLSTSPTTSQIARLSATSGRSQTPFCSRFAKLSGRNTDRMP
jgi:phage shock protein PspC (stress-responsive transcriptional regulator)